MLDDFTLKFHDSRTTFHHKMFSLDAKQLTFIGSAAATLIAGAYVLWGPAEKRKARKKKGESHTLRIFLVLVLSGKISSPELVIFSHVATASSCQNI